MNSYRGDRGQTTIAWESDRSIYAWSPNCSNGSKWMDVLTTLMDVLTGGYIEGDIRIFGFSKKQETFVRSHSPQVNVKESLMELFELNYSQKPKIMWMKRLS
ncbi:hypothetical protein Ddye_014516 [Dipteronia dyeriana]|uniref:Uncharacterized protein n=1 Tax=Dipteronia dyeriana TaxID=168575 RepID=A0AAD9X852_9ROSI|nr:hypothetical protein Ddye_014516 [Dipteronia dyeriana]